MHEPYIAQDGHTYERIAISRWFGTGKTRSPVTNQVLNSQTVIPNHCVRRLIMAYRMELGSKLLTLCKESSQGSSSQTGLSTLIEYGAADVNAKDEDGNTPLIITVQRGHDDWADALLNLGANVSTKNDQGVSALDLARQLGRNNSLIDRMESLMEQEQIKKKLEDEDRKRKQDHFRQEQEQRSKEIEDASSATTNSPFRSARLMNNELAGNSGPGVVIHNSIGFFPSLFGLQFQDFVSTNSTPQSNRSGFSIAEEDIEQHRMLSRAVFTMGCFILLSLCLVF